MKKSKCKIVLVLNHEDRELRTIEKIQAAILRINPHAIVQIHKFRDPRMLIKILEFNPDLIMTFPFTAISTSYQFYILKYLLNCLIVCFPAEGIFNHKSPGIVEEMAGMENIGPSLTDYQLFWGPKPAEKIGRVLLEQNKISSMDRVFNFGWPFFEDYGQSDSKTGNLLSQKTMGVLNQYPRDKKVLLVSGFHLADYSPQDIVGAGDLVDTTSETFQNDFHQVQNLIQKVQQFRRMWINALTTCARNHPDVLFVAKTHPMEQIVDQERGLDSYAELRTFDNILLINEKIPFSSIIPHCSLLLHYGSTTMLEAYLSNVPTVYVTSDDLGLEKIKIYEPTADLGIPSTFSIDIVETADLISRHAAEPIRFERNDEVETFLSDMINYKVGENYRPSDEVGAFLLSVTADTPQFISSGDTNLIYSIQKIGKRVLVDLINQGISEIKNENYPQSLTFFDKALKIAEIGQYKIERLHYFRSLCLFFMGSTDEAVKTLEKEIAVNPEDKEVNDFMNQLKAQSDKSTTGSSAYPQSFDQLIPRTFMVETVLGCDLKCPECALGGDMIKRRKGMLSFENFKKIADKIRPYCDYLFLHIWGEPLLNKDIFKILEYASGFARTNISTNGNILTEEKAEKLILSGVSDLIVSIDGVSQEVYEKYRMGGSADKALWSLKILQELNLKHGNKVRINPQYIVFKHNQHEMYLFRKFCELLELEPSFKAPYIRSNSRYDNSDDPQFVRPTCPDVASFRHSASKCTDPKQVFSVLMDGSCVMCCYDHDGTTNYGNIYEQEVLEIWNSPKYRQDRWDIISGNAPSYCIENCLQWAIEQSDFEEKTESAKAAISTDSPATGGTATMPDAQDPSGISGHPPIDTGRFGPRVITVSNVEDGQQLLELARQRFTQGEYNKAFDTYEQLVNTFPKQAVEILAEVYDQYQLLPQQDRFSLYQSRHYNFGINPTDKVLDIGSGNIPFQYATHLADIAVENNEYGRAGEPFKYIEGKPVYECDLENLEFADKEFDFVYCSHVLEHVSNPEKACKELMRIARRGFIETPTRGKDLWLNTTRISNHRWAIEFSQNKLVFTELSQSEINGLESGILLSMHVAPQTPREKAFSALIYLKANLINTMLLWEDNFDYEVHRLGGHENMEPTFNYQPMASVG